MIPQDTEESRDAFKKVPGMAKFLQKQFVAMVDKAELNLIKSNMGKSSAQRKAFHEVINDNYAYVKLQKNRDGSLNVSQNGGRCSTPTMTNHSLYSINNYDSTS